MSPALIEGALLLAAPLFLIGALPPMGATQRDRATPTDEGAHHHNPTT